MSDSKHLRGTTLLFLAACLFGGLALAGCDQAGQGGNGEPMVNPDENGEGPGGAGFGQDGEDQGGSGMGQEDNGGSTGQ
ncbi:hypothetical protein AN478_13110 [Thiohalorhabdus denitrificans]|uniref:Uncharacterized protein n=1 Tax=Thiohalorhabdus denitrificans TaxID=381306 RepID=A0A0P9CRA4_9GAMM|nr:hypothetical protein [Thiohalorhabdus denitrificans]KPV39207.1 hypothetical protein AN478_13110 [Thiohalorhabdus denitrificans]SCX75311.1 hypothetical protein SAMN05661077_0228 [Thiohalorhabdus denitrificans]